MQIAQSEVYDSVQQARFSSHVSACSETRCLQLSSQTADVSHQLQSPRAAMERSEEAARREKQGRLKSWNLMELMYFSAVAADSLYQQLSLKLLLLV